MLTAGFFFVGCAMRGEELYAIYARANGRQGVHVDPWVELDPLEQEAWNEFADEIDRLRDRDALNISRRFDPKV
jgi:hypothetical protein